MKLKAENLEAWLGKVPAAVLLVVSALAGFSASMALAQSCQVSSDLDAAARSTIITASQHYFDIAAKGDSAALRQNAIASLASDFSSIETTVKDHQKDLAASQATVKSLFVLETEGTTA